MTEIPGALLNILQSTTCAFLSASNLMTIWFSVSALPLLKKKVVAAHELSSLSWSSYFFVVVYHSEVS